MRRKHVVAGAVAVAALAGGTAGAVAATSDERAAERSVLADAAKRLGVRATDLRSALSKAEDAQLDAAVKAGEITPAQAGEIRRHRAREGTVLGLGHGGPGHGFGDHGGPGGRGLLADAAKAIGIEESTLFEKLRDGETLEAIAKANGKTLAAVRSAVEKAATERLDAELKAGRITQAQHDEAIAELGDAIDHLGTFRGHGPHGPHGPHGDDDGGRP